MRTQVIWVFCLHLLVCASCGAAEEAPVVAQGPVDLVESYAAQGQLILASLSSAPFPHPERAEGRRYNGQFYSAKDHYSDSTVALFIPRGFRETGTVDFVVHFHGWTNHVARVLSHYQLIEQLVASGRNAVLVVPQGPMDAPDSFGGKLEDLEGFKHFMEDVAQTLRQKSTLKNKDFALGKIVLCGHSGGGRVISFIVDVGGLTDHVREVWMFDALYEQTPQILAWIERKQGRFIDLYTEQGGTQPETEHLISDLKTRGIAAFAGNDTQTSGADLQSHAVVFLQTDLAHNEVIYKRRAFCDYLKTSCLGDRGR